MPLERLGDGMRDARVRQAEALIAVAERAEALWWTDMRASKRVFGAEAQNISEALGWLRGPEPLLHAPLLAAAARQLSDSGRSAECVVEIDAALGWHRLPADLRARLLCRRAIAVESDDPLAASEVAVAACRESAAAAISSRRCSACRPATASSPTARARCGPPARRRRSRADCNDRVAADLADLAMGTALALVGRPAEALALMTLLDRRVPPGGRIAMNTTVARADTALACGDFQGALDGYCRWLRTHHALNSYVNEAFQLDGAAMALTALERFEEAVVAAEISDLLRAERTIDAPPSTASPATPTSPAPTEPSAPPGVEQRPSHRPPARRPPRPPLGRQPRRPRPDHPTLRHRRPTSDPRQSWLEWPRSALSSAERPTGL